ncbi:hypothetical protein B5D77_16360 [Microcystis sp. MC19]|nr:hypothetical protein B5D77_16360 [Microcystis sp. MC19]
MNYEVGKWGSGEWGSREVGKWGSREVGKWGSREVGKLSHHPITPKPYHPITLFPDDRLLLWLSQLWWVKCILRYISQERGGGTNHKDTKDTKIDRSYVN